MSEIDLRKGELEITMLTVVGSLYLCMVWVCLEKGFALQRVGIKISH